MSATVAPIRPAKPALMSPAQARVDVVEAAHRVREVHRGLARLVRLCSPWRIVAVAPREACRACGVDRAMLSHISDGTLRFAGASYDRDPQVAADFIRLARAARLRLADGAPELEAATRQMPILVDDAQHRSGLMRLLVATSRTPAYVVAPIVQNGVTIGLLHGDRFDPEGRPLDELDCELLWLFATGLGWAMEQAIAESRPAPRPAPEPSSRAILDHALAELTGGASPVPAYAALSPLGTLTTREREVLAFLADGASNAAIADALVISEATVKSHVRHILRKLAASNRTEAVARYHALTAAGAAVARA